MPFDKLKDPKSLWDERRKAVLVSLEPVSVEELKKVGKNHEGEFADDPSREELVRLVTERPQAGFYRAVAQEGVVVFYCQDADFGIWVLEGSGMGPLDNTGKRLMKEAIGTAASGGKIGGKTNKP